jgi:regulatory protein
MNLADQVCRRVTAIKKSERGRLNVFLDGEPSLSVASEVATGQRLKVGQHLSLRQLESLAMTDEVYEAQQVAVRHLGHRPRSEREIRDRLRRGGFSPDIIGTVMARLKELGLVDDVAFARFWRESRDSRRPSSRWLLRQELRRKGINSEIIDEIVQNVDEESGACETASKKARSLGTCDEGTFHRRLESFLRRRGYGYELTRRVVERLWLERLTNQE